MEVLKIFLQGNCYLGLKVSGNDAGEVSTPCCSGDFQLTKKACGILVELLKICSGGEIFEGLVEVLKKISAGKLLFRPQSIRQ